MASIEIILRDDEGNIIGHKTQKQYKALHNHTPFEVYCHGL